MGQQQRRFRQLCALLFTIGSPIGYEPRRHESTALVTQSQITSVQFKEKNTNLHDRISLQLRPVQDVAIFLTVHHAPSSQGLAISKGDVSLPRRPRVAREATTKESVYHKDDASVCLRSKYFSVCLFRVRMQEEIARSCFRVTRVPYSKFHSAVGMFHQVAS